MFTVGRWAALGALAIACAGCDSPAANYAPVSTDEVATEDSVIRPPGYWAGRLTSRSATARREALVALGNAGRDAAEYAPLIARLLTDPDERTGFTAAWALAHIGSSAHPLLLDRLDSKRTVERQRATYGVGEMGPAGAVATERLKVLENDPDSKVRNMAVWALGQVLARQMIPDPNIALLTGIRGDLEERLAAIERLGATVHTSPVAVRELIILMGDSIPLIREQAILALAQAGTTALPSLSAALSHRKPEIRRGAMLAISRMHRVF